MTSLVIAEHDHASIKGATLNTVTAALACGGDVHVLVAGHNAGAAAQAASQIAGVSKVIHADSDALAHGLAENVAAQVLAIAAHYTHILFPATAGGKNVANFRIACSKTWKDKAGQKQERTEWHRVAIFNDRLVEIAEKYLRKGSKVYLEGQLQTRKWQGNDGSDKFTTEVVLTKFRGELVMLDGRGEGHAGGGGETPPGGADLDDDIPFITPWGNR